jgi:hypothetical protein
MWIFVPLFDFANLFLILQILPTFQIFSFQNENLKTSRYMIITQ